MRKLRCKKKGCKRPVKYSIVARYYVKRTDDIVTRKTRSCWSHLASAVDWVTKDYQVCIVSVLQ